MNRAYAEELVIATFSERPDLLGRVFGPEIQSAVPEFMRHDPAGALYYSDRILDGYREYGLVAVHPTEPDRPIARAFSVPFAFCDGTVGRDELPDGGWDEVIRWAHQDRAAGQRPTAVSAPCQARSARSMSHWSRTTQSMSSPICGSATASLD
jgi:hypothetical protein